jgi:alkyl hydroperoxide reductase subunit AhpF
MALLDQQVRDQVSQLFAELDGPVQMIFYTVRQSALVLPGQTGPECPSCADEEQLLTELAELSDKVTLEVHDVRDERAAAEEAGIDKLPALVLRGPSTAGRVRFFGLPAGYEFSTLVADLVDVSRGTVELTDKAKAQLDALEEPVHLQVFVTPT